MGKATIINIPEDSVVEVSIYNKKQRYYLWLLITIGIIIYFLKDLFV